MSYTDMIIPGLTYNKEGFERAGKENSLTLLAIAIVLFYEIMVTVDVTLSGVAPPSSGLSNSNLAGTGLFVSMLVSQLLHDFLQVYFIAVIAKYAFGSELTFTPTLRLYAAVMVWNYIAYILGFFFELGFGIFLFFFIFNIGFMIALTTYDSMPMWKSFVSIVVGFGLEVAVNHVVMNYALIPIFG